jgi:hypothetical protein
MYIYSTHIHKVLISEGDGGERGGGKPSVTPNITPATDLTASPCLLPSFFLDDA